MNNMLRNMEVVILTEQEAIKSLKNIVEYWICRPTEVEAAKMAIVALEKQIPKNPIMEKWEPALCPSCGAELSESKGDGYYEHHYCLNICECGQKLKWDE